MIRTITMHQLKDGSIMQHGPRALTELKKGNIARTFDAKIEFDISEIIAKGAYKSLTADGISTEELIAIGGALK